MEIIITLQKQLIAPLLLEEHWTTIDRLFKDNKEMQLDVI